MVNKDQEECLVKMVLLDLQDNLAHQENLEDQENKD